MKVHRLAGVAFVAAMLCLLLIINGGTALGCGQTNIWGACDGVSCAFTVPSTDGYVVAVQQHINCTVYAYDYDKYGPPPNPCTSGTPYLDTLGNYGWWCNKGTLDATSSSQPSMGWTAPCAPSAAGGMGGAQVTCWVYDASTGSRHDFAPGSAFRTFEVVCTDTANGIAGPDVVCVGECATFTCDTIPSGHKSMNIWGGGDEVCEQPGSGNNYAYKVKWTTAGVKTVSVHVSTAASPCDLVTKQVLVVDKVHTVEIDQPTGTIGGEVQIRVKVRTSACVTNDPPTLKYKETTTLHTANWVDFTEYPLVEDGGTVNGIKTTYYTWIWNTADRDGSGNPVVHNSPIGESGGGPHVLRATIAFHMPGVQDPDVLTDDQDVTVKNLVITAVDPPDYLVWKGGPGTTRIGVDLDSQDTDDPMDITLTIWPTGEEASIASITLTGVTGNTHYFDWDGKDYSQNYVNPGCYTYQVEVSQSATSDYADYRSRYLDATSHDTWWVLEENGDLKEELYNDQMCYIRDFVYELNEDPTAVHVDLYDVDLNPADASDILTDRVRDADHPVVLHHPVLNDEQVERGDLSSTTVVCAIDGRAECYRDHRNRPMLAWNKWKPIEVQRYVLVFDLTENDASELDIFYGMSMCQETVWHTHSDTSWEATSGNNNPPPLNGHTEHMNRRACEWESDNQGYSRSVGPIPHREDIQDSPYKVRLKELPPTRSKTHGMELRSSDGRILGYKYLITSWTEAPDDQVGTIHELGGTRTRQLLRIHPDGGPSYGTNGCIGVGGEGTHDDRWCDAQACRDELNRLDSLPNLHCKGVKDTDFKKRYMPLYVMDNVATVVDYNTIYTRYVYEVKDRVE